MNKKTLTLTPRQKYMLQLTKKKEPQTREIRRVPLNTIAAVKKNLS